MKHTKEFMRILQFQIQGMRAMGSLCRHAAWCQNMQASVPRREQYVYIHAICNMQGVL